MNPAVAVRRHPRAFAVGGVALVGVVLGALAWRSARARRSDSWMDRGQRLLALGRVVDRPDEIAREQPSIGKKILTAAAVAVVGVVARRAAIRFLARSS